MIRRISISRSREWLWGLAFVTMIAGPGGCPNQSSDNTGDSSDPNRAGLFINDKSGDPLLLFGRAEPGEFFVFGTRTASGNLDEIESILIQAKNGEKSFITFESGRPVHVQGPDGSYAHVTYTEISQQRFTATVDVFIASSGEKQQYVVDIDLQKTAQQIATLVSQATGQQLTAPSTAGAATAKGDSRSLRITVFSPLFSVFVAPLAAIVGLTTIVLGQILTEVYAVVIASLQVALLVIFSPLFLLTSLFTGSVVNIELVPINEVLRSTPLAPFVELR
ncbi:MAG: hypothetical protein U1D55_15000 [Phycisphaerae bacterium]